MASFSVVFLLFLFVSLDVRRHLREGTDDLIKAPSISHLVFSFLEQSGSLASCHFLLVVVRVGIGANILGLASSGGAVCDAENDEGPKDVKEEEKDQGEHNETRSVRWRLKIVQYLKILLKNLTN